MPAEDLPEHDSDETEEGSVLDPDEDGEKEEEGLEIFEEEEE